MIFGIGTDIVEIKRIKTMTSLDKFASKILSHNEKEFYDSLTNQKQIVYISKQFAAKEAIAKAIGTGIRNDTHFKNIEILRDENGAPIFNALNKLEKIIGRELSIRCVRNYGRRKRRAGDSRPERTRTLGGHHK